MLNEYRNGENEDEQVNEKIASIKDVASLLLF